MNAHVYETAKVNDIPHSAHQFHARFQVFQFHDVPTPEQRRRQFVTWVTPRLFQFLENVPHSGFAYACLFRNGRNAVLLGNGTDLAAVLSGNVCQPETALLQDLLCCPVAFRMHCCIVQRVLGSGHPQESGTLLECLRAQFCHLFQLLPVSERPVFRPVCHDVLGNGLVDAGNVGQ